MRSDLAESLARNEAAMARSEASSKETAAENSKAIEKLRTDMYRAIMAGVVASVVILGVLITILDRSSPPVPIYYQPPAASVLSTPN